MDKNYLLEKVFEDNIKRIILKLGIALKSGLFSLNGKIDTFKVTGLETQLENLEKEMLDYVTENSIFFHFN